MDELSRKRLDRKSKWDAEETIRAILHDIETNSVSLDIPGGKVIRVMCLCVVENPRTKNIAPVVYSSGFESIPEELGYIDVMRDKLMSWWRRSPVHEPDSAS